MWENSPQCGTDELELWAQLSALPQGAQDRISRQCREITIPGITSVGGPEDAAAVGAGAGQGQEHQCGDSKPGWEGGQRENRAGKRGTKRSHHRAVAFSCGAVRAVLFTIFRLKGLNLSHILLLPITAATPAVWNRSFLGKQSTLIKLSLGFLLSGPEGKERKRR